MILTLTVNPAIDRNVTVDRLVFDDRAYILDTNETPGGRGLNASQVLHSFGAKTEAVLTAGGDTGSRMRQMLASSGFPVHLVPSASPTRLNMNITDKQGLTVKLNEKGSPPLSPTGKRYPSLPLNSACRQRYATGYTSNDWRTVPTGWPIACAGWGPGCSRHCGRDCRR